ncbi:hypothetical protein SARC_08625 [Sphaeroforma arctica JP610]|uniref:Peptidase M24 domain-containing protein n=1 Tax=Sphaeroforma arctica JP610 TaxID=667725 RepID=A0A0L0FQA0_9EUKA|nr:hypothetical protein SARC_08625 [Sphaeroforma arctica JP610]KNC78962.1 hypothetical protein SARC_08625 [Sphaeroforma arctica JP610]|eukprot:XP_014152864.1 hypothetical protein SARC_08625 [Sphaeroforma arctica JP610]
MREELNSVYKTGNVEKNIAFPTCVSINNCVGNYSSLPDDPFALSAGDVVKIEMAAHIGGNVATVCHTHVVPSDGKTPLQGRAADTICAAYYASETALRMIKPGASIYQVDIAMTTGQGKTKDLDVKPSVYRRNRDRVYQLKLKGSRALFGQILKTNPDCAFSIRDYVQWDPRHTAMGLPECLKSELLLAYPVRFEPKTEIVARYRFTMLLLPSGPVRITGAGVVPYVQSEFSIDNADLNALLETAVNDKSDTTAKKAKKGTKSKNNFATEPQDVNMAM